MHPFEEAVLFLLNDVMRRGDNPAYERASKLLARLADGAPRETPQTDPAAKPAKLPADPAKPAA